MRLTVQDVMTSEVVVVRELTSFHDLVRLLTKHHVSALPVVDGGGRVVGVVCESDLFLKQVEPIRDGAGRLLEGRRSHCRAAHDRAGGHHPPRAARHRCRPAYA